MSAPLVAMWPSPEAYSLARKARLTPKTHGDICYGVFHGGDPRDFTPDAECSTSGEMAKHRADCEAWERGEQQPRSADCEHAGGIILTRSTYGLGVNSYDVPCEGRNCSYCEYLGPPDWPLQPDVRVALDQVRRARGQRKAERRRMRGGK